MKYVRIFLVFIAVVALFVVGGLYLTGRVGIGAFESAAQDKDLKRLFDVAAASAGSSLARGGAEFQPGKVAGGEGAIAYYQKNPQSLLQDKQYFETWVSALAVADATSNNSRRFSKWESSDSTAGIPSSNRIDSWGHFFCVHSDQRLTLVVSAGPLASGSLDCSTLRVSDEEAKQMPKGRLNPGPSGLLILVVKTPDGNG